MRHLVWTLSMFAWALAPGACGDSDVGGSDPSGKGGAGGSAGAGTGGGTSSIVYPDSSCTDSTCVANSDHAGTCDSNASDPMLDDCNAWRINGSFSLTAVKIDETAKRGTPPPLSPSDDDACPPNSVTPAGKTEHCCERVLTQSDKPAFMLTGVTLRDPPVFGLTQVSSTNKTAIEEDRYNWIMQLSSDQPGDVMIKSGLGLRNEDGSFAFARGAFELGGETWNQGGEWDPHAVPGVLGADGSLRYRGQYMPAGRYFQLPLWGVGYDFTMMVLSMTGIEMAIQLAPGLVCGGFLTGNKSFDQPGDIRAYLPLEPLRGVKLHFRKGDEGTGLCPLTAGVTPADCGKPVAEWGK